MLACHFSRHFTGMYWVCLVSIFSLVIFKGSECVAWQTEPCRLRQLYPSPKKTAWRPYGGKQSHVWIISKCHCQIPITEKGMRPLYILYLNDQHIKMPTLHMIPVQLLFGWNVSEEERNRFCHLLFYKASFKCFRKWDNWQMCPLHEKLSLYNKH